MEVIKNRLRKITPITVEDKVWGIRRNLVETEIKVAPFENEPDDCKFTKSKLYRLYAHTHCRN